jgi:hypothetical protein
MLKAFFLISVTAAGIAAAQTPNIDVKLGLWETTTVSKSAGMPQMDLSNLPPEARARVEAAMKARGATPTTHTNRSCMTKEKLEKNTLFNPDQVKESCKRTIVTNTRTVVEVKIECPNEKYPMTGTMHFEMTSRESMKGTMKVQSGPMNMDMDITGKWLGENCGDVK